MRTLAELVQGLPAELYNEILDLTLTPDSEAVEIDKSYLTPVQLQINRACRKVFEDRYYKHTTFVTPDTKSPILRPWANSLAVSTIFKLARVCLRLENFMSITKLRAMREITIAGLWTKFGDIKNTNKLFICEMYLKGKNGDMITKWLTWTEIEQLDNDQLVHPDRVEA